MLSAQNTQVDPWQLTTPIPCQNVTTPGSITNDQSIVKGQTPAPILEAAPAEGGEGELKYQWMVYKKYGAMPAQWYPIMSATQANYQPSALHQTTQFARCVSRAGCNKYIQSNVITITVTEENI